MENSKTLFLSLILSFAITTAVGCGDDDDDGSGGSPGSAGSAGQADDAGSGGTEADASTGEEPDASTGEEPDASTGEEPDASLAELEIAGTYSDDFQGSHQITGDSWTQVYESGTSVFNISQFSNEEGYLIAQNDADNEFNPELWSRFDWTEKDGTLWYCQSVYDAESEQEALDADPADDSDPANSGCGGFAWSELKPPSYELDIAGDYMDNYDTIQQITDEAREVINRLGTQMEAVGRILTVIGDVAEQTNLLALNAAIIAAAAGEHGKGFAVVADEIKDLADRTSTSTKEIAGLIRSVQTESRRAIDAMQRGSGSVRRGVELANHAGEALKQILSSVQQVTEMAKDIAKTAADHSTITRNITKSMTNISSMVRQIKRAVTEQSTSGSRVNRVSEQMRDDARFVFRSANEQVQAATGVTKNMERISEMVSFVSKAMSEQSNGVNHVAKVAEEVRDTIEQERAQIADLEEITDRIGRQAGEFSRYLENFDKEGELE